jgi:hypothetical protein
MTSTSAIGLFLFTAWTIIGAFTTPITARTGLEGRLLPSFDLQLTDSTTHMNTADIPTGNSFIIIGFSPECKHCGAETDDIIKNIAQFRGMPIYFVTPFPYSEMKGFYHHFKLTRYQNIIMGRDSSNFFMSYFKAGGVPFTTVFDSKKRLKVVINNQANAKNLLRAAEQ